MANISVSRKSGFIQRSGQMRRKTTWIGGAYANIVLASGIPQIVTSLGAAALALRPFTIVRTRGVLLIGTDQEAADEAQRVIYGEAVVSDEASAVGITAVPTPITESNSNLWFVYEPMAAFFRFGDATGWSQTQVISNLDSKAMRKVEVGQDILSIAENTGDGASLIAYSRTLVKLH